jgi:hypothetical protein
MKVLAGMVATGGTIVDVLVGLGVEIAELMGSISAVIDDFMHGDEDDENENDE